MPVLALLTWVQSLRRTRQPRWWRAPGPLPLPAPGLSELYAQDETNLPRLVQESSVALKYLRLLGPLDWSRFPERPDERIWPNVPPLPYAALAAAYLVKLDQNQTYMSDLRDYLVDHPVLVWLLGFPLVATRHTSWGFDVDASLPTHRHLSRLLRQMPNATLQFLLDETVRLIRAELRDEAPHFGDCISLDTKHLLAWVQENNPKAYLTKNERFDKTRQPKGDPDCRLGCKRKHNLMAATPSGEPMPTPTTNPLPASSVEVGEYYWGYASGVVATKVADWGEFVLAELTQPFDQPDVSYFFPLMKETERRLGFRPKFGAFDAAFDAFYVYEYFHRDDGEGFAAVPFSERGGHKARQFSPDGAPICQAGLPMVLKYTFLSRSGLFEHECQRYVCPLRFPQPSGQTCPKNHPNWAKKGCVSTLAASIGARLRYQIDRHGQAYKEVYKQRTATERINSQAVELGIERPKLRNQASIANHNTLTYVLINLRALQRIRQRKAQRLTQPPPVAPTDAAGEDVTQLL
jgi:hypothetical protein